MVDARIVIKIQGDDSEGRRIKRTLDDVAKSGNRATGATNKLKNSLVALGGATAALLLIKNLTRASIQFSTALAEVSTLLNDTAGEMDKLTESAKKQSIEFGSTPVEQTKAFYQIISAGAKTAAIATERLTVANKLAVGGVTTVEIAADGLTSVMNAYGKAIESATAVSDSLFVAMRAGKTTIKELSSSLGKVLPFAAPLKVTFDELTASIAALTKGGISTTEAVTGVRAILAAISKPTKEAQKEAKALGIEFSAAGLQGKGFTEFLKDVVERTGGSVSKITQLFGGVEALVPVLAFSGAAGKAMNEILVDMGNKAGATEKAFKKMTDSPGFKLDQFFAVMSVKAIELGDNFVNVLAPAASFITKNIDSISTAISVLSTIAIAGLIGKLGSLAGAFIINIRLQRASAVAALALAKANLAAGGSFTAVAKAQTLLAASTIGLGARLVSLRVAGAGFLALMGGWPGVLIAAGIAAFTFKDNIRNGIIIALTEIVIFAERAIIKLKELATFSFRGLSALLATGAEKLGFIDQSTLDKILLKSPSGEFTPKFDPEILRREAQNLITKLNKDQGTGEGTTKDTLTDVKTEIDKIIEALKGTETGITTVINSTNILEDSIVKVANETNRFADNTASAFTRFVTGAASARDALRSIINDLISLSARESITGPLSSLLSAAIGGFTGSIFGGGTVTPPLPVRRPSLAHGGAMVLGGAGGIDQNVLSLNGRPIADVTRGETLTVTPQGRSGGSGITINQTINISLGIQETVRTELVNFLPELQKSTIAAVADANSRGFN